MASTLIPPPNAQQLSAFWTWMGDDGICRTKTRPRALVTIREARQNSLAVNALFKGIKFPLLVDARDIKQMTREARSHFSVNGRETRINSFAVIISSPLSRVIGNFFMGLNKPAVPARLFDQEAPAIAWLKQYVTSA